MKTKRYYVEEKIVEALINLLKDHSLDNITVQELCEKAGVGRASFYRHYQNKEQILKDHAQSLIQEWTRDFESSAHEQPSDVFVSLFTHLKDNQEFYEILHSTGWDHILKDTIRYKLGVTPELSNLDAYQKVFFADGMTGWIEEWIERGMQESPDELNTMLGDYFINILSNLKAFYTAS